MAAAEAADAAAVPAAAVKANKCPEKQQSKISWPPFYATPLLVPAEFHNHLRVFASIKRFVVDELRKVMAAFGRFDQSRGRSIESIGSVGSVILRIFRFFAM